MLMTMTIQIILLLLGAGFLGGIANSMAGGASLFTFPALLATGLPPIIANASNAVAVTSSNAVGFLSDLKKLPQRDFFFWLSFVVIMVGGGLGGLLLLATPEKTFTQSVPALIGVATLIFAFAKPIQNFLTRVLGGGSEHQKLRMVLLFPAAIYGGYFGAGLGVIIISVLNATSSWDLRGVNALKNALGFLANVAAIGFFVWNDVISWPETLVMMLGALAGGFTGVKLTKVLDPKTVRRVIIACGTMMTAIYVYRFWL
jgi:uncharacterized membrane protein YfcA